MSLSLNFIVFTKQLLSFILLKNRHPCHFATSNIICNYGYGVGQFQENHQAVKNDIRQLRLTKKMNIFPILAQYLEKRDIDHANASMS